MRFASSLNPTRPICTYVGMPVTEWFGPRTLDVMDPSEAPGTGTPEIGGLGYQELRECLAELVARDNLVGFDMVEVAPPYDSSEITAQVAARLIIDVLAARFPSQ